MLSALVVEDPLVARDPSQPPEAVQEVALVEDQVSVVLAPVCTVLGLAARFTVGIALVTDTVAECVALPPAPVQVS